MSNHSSGTAIDINATRHPMGVPIRQTMLPWQIAKINTRLRVYSGCLTWGAAWRRPDGMHVEISTGKSLEQVERVARARCNTAWGKEVLEANPGLRKVIFS